MSAAARPPKLSTAPQSEVPRAMRRSTQLFTYLFTYLLIYLLTYLLTCVCCMVCVCACACVRLDVRCMPTELELPSVRQSRQRFSGQEPAASVASESRCEGGNSRSSRKLWGGRSKSPAKAKRKMCSDDQYATCGFVSPTQIGVARFFERG